MAQRSSSTDEKDQDQDQVKSKEETYSIDLFDAFPKVCQKAKCGVQMCHAVSTFVTERMALENNYAQALLKLAQNAQAEDWSEQFTHCWKTFREAMEHLAHERSAFASIMQTAIVPGAKAFAIQQESQVQRLITEGTKVRWAQQQVMLSMKKAREKYDRKCQEAIEVIATMRKSDTMALPDTELSSEEVSTSKELTDKLAAGAGQLLTKMWDTTSAFGRNPLERQRSKLSNCLEDVIAAEKSYRQTVEYTNAQGPIYERNVKENLHAFQLTEEQRLEYLRDVLMRMQKAFTDMFARSQQSVERMKASVNEVNEIVDIEKGFQSLGGKEDVVDVDQADLSLNPFYLRMTHLQAMSDDGQRMIETMNSFLTELVACETRLAQSLRKLLRTHDNAGLSSSSELFGNALSTVQSTFVNDEGATMANGWMAVKDQLKLLLEVHQEFKSLLAEPVSLSLDTMKREYESLRVSTQDNFVKLHAMLCNETATHKKLQQKLETKSREFSTGCAHLLGTMPPLNAAEGTMDVTQTLKLLSRNLPSFNEKERRSEAKVRQVGDEILLLQTQVRESSSTLRETYQTYIQEIEMFISTYMKNEKYRLQVGKNALQSLAKAIEHMLHGGTSVGHKALVEFVKIDPNKDIAEFIRTNRQPYKPSKRIVVTYHGNESLKEEMREYFASLGAPSSENVEKTPLSPSNGLTRPLSSTDVVSLAEKTALDSTSARKEDDPATTFAKDHGNTSFGMEQQDEFAPLGVSDFQKKFKLDSPEQVVESFSCALYLSNFPFHGRLYLTKNRMCFSGWRDTIFVASFSQIATMEKKNTALIVPNAIEFTINQEKVFFTSFVFRDECYQSIQQLRSIKKETEAILSDPPTPDSTLDATSKSLSIRESKRPQRCENLAAVAPSPALASPDATSLPTLPKGSSNLLSSNASPVIADKDAILSEYDLLLDEELPFSVETAFSTLWIESDTFSRRLLDAGGSTNISLPPWEKQTIVYTAVSTPDTFDASRSVVFTHNKKYMVGPSVIPTSQMQRYAYKRGSRLVVSTTTCVSDVPYCDYFRVEHRWVFSTTKTRGKSLVQVGLRIQWSKSTWLKKQIESTTISEAKDSVKTWLNAALIATKHLTTENTAAGSVDPTAGARGQEKSSLKPSVALTGLPATSLVHTKPASVVEVATQLSPTLQKLLIFCALVFIYTMYRVGAALDELRALTRESLSQQRLQYEALKELLDQLKGK